MGIMDWRGRLGEICKVRVSTRRILRENLRAQTLPAARSPARQHFSTATRCHARTKSMTALPNEATWLIRTLHLAFPRSCAAPSAQIARSICRPDKCYVPLHRNMLIGHRNALADMQIVKSVIRPDDILIGRFIAPRFHSK